MFASRPIFGMIHLRPLPGAPLFAGSLDAVIDAALADGVPPETVAAMTRVIAEVTRELALPFGVNVLRNDASSALAIAAATGAAFIRVNVHTGAMLTDQGIIEGRAAETLRLRARLAPHVLVFADHRVKHAAPLADVDEEQAAKDLRQRGLADAVIVSGRETGAAPDAARFARVRAAVDGPLLVGSGLSEANAGAFADVTAVLVLCGLLWGVYRRR